MRKPVIIFEGVSKSYPLYHHITGGLKSFLFNFRKSVSGLKDSHFEALRDVSLKIHEGETVGIIGRNGAGKSSLLGLIAGVLKPTRGSVTVNGRVSPLLELGAGFHPELTGRENIVLNGVLMGLTRANVFEKVDRIIGFSELEDFIDQPIRTYSTGMLTRLGFSVAVHLDPEIFLIDEVLSVGDKGFQKKCVKKIIEFKEKGVTMVFVSHMLEEMELICDRVAWIDDHTVRMEGDPVEVISSYLRSFEPRDGILNK